MTNETTNPPVKLTYLPMTRALRPRWLLEELGVPYELVRPQDRSHLKTAEHLAQHPLGRIPTMVDGNVTLFESAAIILYLADKHLDKGLAPSLSSPDRAPYLQWIIFAMTELEPQIALVMDHMVTLPEAQRVPAVAEAARQRFAKVVVGALPAVEGKQFVLGDKFSAADIILGSVLGWARMGGLLEGHPQLIEYQKRCTGRPAFKRARAD